MKLSSYNPIAARRTVIAIADRGMLGAVTFLTSIILGRWGGPGELGLFAIFFSLVFLALAVQESLTIGPYSLLAAARADGRERRRYLGGALADAGAFCAVVALLFLTAAVVLWACGWSRAATTSFVLALASPCMMLREFARRTVYADFRPHAALAISAGVSALQLAMMGALYAAGQLTAASSFSAMGLSSLIGAAGWLYVDRATFELGAADRSARYREHWDLGRWLLAGQVSEIVRINMLPWLLALAVDEVTVGIFAACSFVASLPTPLHVAVSNLLVPQMAHLERRSGLVQTDRLVRQATAWLTAAMVAYSAVVIAFSAHLVPWIYGDRFTGTQHPLIVLAVAWAITGATLPAARALLVIKRPDQMLWAQLAGIAANLALGVPMTVAWGATGAAYAVLVGSAVKGGLSYWWYAVGVRALLAESGSTVAEESRPTPPVLRELAFATANSPGLATEEAR